MGRHSYADQSHEPRPSGTTVLAKSLYEAAETGLLYATPLLDGQHTLLLDANSPAMSQERVGRRLTTRRLGAALQTLSGEVLFVGWTSTMVGNAPENRFFVSSPPAYDSKRASLRGITKPGPYKLVPGEPLVITQPPRSSVDWQLQFTQMGDQLIVAQHGQPEASTIVYSATKDMANAGKDLDKLWAPPSEAIIQRVGDSMLSNTLIMQKVQ